MVLCPSRDGIPLKFNKKLVGLQFSNMECLSLVLTPIRICWTILLNAENSAFLSSTESKLYYFEVFGGD